MKTEQLIGVDIGTQGVKAAIFTGKGRCLAEALIKSRLYQPSPGITEEDPEFQLKGVCRAIRDCIQQSRISPESVAALAIDGQMAGVIGIDRSGHAITPYDSWLDTRCAPYIKKMWKIAGDEVLSKT